MAKEGSTISGMMDAFATSISLTLQYGVPLVDLIQKFSHMRFEPSGRTENASIPVAQSVVDYVFRWMASQFLSPGDAYAIGVMTPEVKAQLAAGQYPLPMTGGAIGVDNAANIYNDHEVKGNGAIYADAPACVNCGWIMIRSGTCYRCENCGSTSGCS